jgi:mitochondrial import receptor subunit TOM40
MIQFEQDYLGQDYSLNAKIVNPWPTDLTGIFMGSYLQSITKNLAVGVESLFQRPNPSLSEFSTSYIAKYTSSAQDWIATMQLQPAGLLQATYWHKLSEKVEAAADLQLIAHPTRRDAIATLGVKYDLRMAQFRAQVDSTGKVVALLEQRFLPTFLFMVSGEIDHYQVHAQILCKIYILLTFYTGHCQVWSRHHAREFQFDTGGDGSNGALITFLSGPIASHPALLSLYLNYAVLGHERSYLLYISSR